MFIFISAICTTLPYLVSWFYLGIKETRPFGVLPLGPYPLMSRGASSRKTWWFLRTNWIFIGWWGPNNLLEKFEFLLVGEEDNAKERLDLCPWTMVHTTHTTSLSRWSWPSLLLLKKKKKTKTSWNRTTLEDHWPLWMALTLHTLVLDNISSQDWPLAARICSCLLLLASASEHS